MKTRNSHPSTEFYSTYKANKEKSIKFMQFGMIIMIMIIMILFSWTDFNQHAIRSIL